MMKKIRGWSDDQLKYIEENFNNKTVAQIASDLCKTYNSTYYVIRELGLQKQTHNKWTPDDVQYLKDNYIHMTSDEIASYLNRSVNSVNAMRDRLGLVRNESWSDDEINYLINNYNNMTHEEIGIKLNRSVGAVRAKCFDLNLYKKEKPWSDFEIEFIQNNYIEMSLVEISECLNRSVSAVKLKASRMGMKKSPYKCNYHYFEIIDTEDKAYWLGFLMADGWIGYNDKYNAGVIGVEIQYGDIDHLRKFNKCLNGNYKINDRWRVCNLTNKKTHSCILRIYSLTMYNDLVKLGFTHNKSFEALIPDMPEHLKRHFIRGYFDGNGSIHQRSKNNCFIKITTASKKFKDEFITLMAENKIVVSEYNKLSEYNTMIYEPYISGTGENRLKFLHYIYDDSTIYLERKYKRYCKFLNRTN